MILRFSVSVDVSGVRVWRFRQVSHLPGCSVEAGTDAGSRWWWGFGSFCFLDCFFRMCFLPSSLFFFLLFSFSAFFSATVELLPVVHFLFRFFSCSFNCGRELYGAAFLLFCVSNLPLFSNIFPREHLVRFFATRTFFCDSSFHLLLKAQLMT